MEGTSSNRTTIDIALTVNKNRNIIPSLLAAHAISGCDTVAYMWGIGKVSVVKVLDKGIHTLEKVGDVHESMPDIIKECTDFVAACYGCKPLKDMSDVRYQTWLNKTGKRKICKTPDLKSLPPTTQSFTENVKRAHLQTSIWKAAMEPDPPNLAATDYGWKKDELAKSLFPVMKGEGADAPDEVLQMIRCGCASDKPCLSSKCGCHAAQLPCTAFCNCHLTENCLNPRSKVRVDSDDSESED